MIGGMRRPLTVRAVHWACVKLKTLPPTMRPCTALSWHKTQALENRGRAIPAQLD